MIPLKEGSRSLFLPSKQFQNTFLNNFARYPTISIGLLVSILRKAEFQVDVFSPLTTGVTGVVREKPVPPWGQLTEQIKFRTALSTNRLVRTVRTALTKTALHAPRLQRATDKVATDVQECLDDGQYDAVLVSSYLMYKDLCEQIGRLCKSRNTPMLLGGPYYAQPEVRAEWMDITGLTGLVGGEVEPYLTDLVQAAINGDSLDAFPGVWTADVHKPNAPPLQDLDSVPFPDYSDFPWHLYPNRIVPIATGRGCSWGACTFCSDVTGSAHRTFRSRTIGNVLDEVKYQADRFGVKLFVFTDPKLNSHLDVWDGLLNDLPNHVDGVEWIGAIHIDSTRPRNGLTRRELDAARAAGMVRLTTGIESGSQRVTDLMKKGATTQGSQQVVKDAAAAGISVRLTMIVGYPGETAADVKLTAEFLESHADSIERVLLSRFGIKTGTRFHRDYLADPSRFPEISATRDRHEIAYVEHDFENFEPGYLKAIDRVIAATHSINRKPLRDTAREFDGVM